MISRRSRVEADVELGLVPDSQSESANLVVGPDGFIEWGDPVAGAVLCVSSVAFLGSTSMIYTLEVYSGPAICLSAIAVVTFLVSVNYWRKAVKGFRRDMDVVVAKASFLLHMVIVAVFLRDGCAAVVACVLGFASIAMFLFAGRLYNLRTRAWVAGHVAFHCCVGLNMMMCVLAMERPNLEKEVVEKTPFVFLENIIDSFGTHLTGCSPDE